MAALLVGVYDVFVREPFDVPSLPQAAVS